MYHIGRKVYVKDLNVIAKVSEANYAIVQGKRKAQYLVEYKGSIGVESSPTRDYLCGSESLRAHDYFCDGCGKSRRANQMKFFSERGSDETIGLCWVCIKEGEEALVRDSFDRVNG